MWVIKTKEEYKNDRSKKLKETVKFSFIISLILAAVTSIMGKYGCRARNDPRHYDLTWKQFFDEIPEHLIFGILMFIAFIIGFYFFEQKKIICDTCWKEKNTNKDRCSCGGEFIDSNNYKWINTTEKEKNPIFDEIKNLDWKDFKNIYNIELSDFIFSSMTLDVPDKFKFTNPNLYLIIKSILELTHESSYLQIIKPNKSYLQITLNSEDNFILVYHEKKLYLVESSRDMNFFNIIEALNLYYNDFKSFEIQYKWIELVNTVS